MSLPILEILFALALSLLPGNVEKFSVETSELKDTVTWTLEADGWHGKSAAGKDMGVWKLEGMTVIKVVEGETTKQEVTDWLTIQDNGPAKAKSVTIGTTPARIESTENSIRLTQANGAPDKDPIVISFTKKQE